MKYQHMKLPDPDKFRCLKCNYTCTFKSQIVMHVKQVHKKIKDFKCEHCSYRCSMSATLKSHIMRCHSVVKRYVCELCDFGCDNKKPFSEHIEVSHPDHRIRHCNQILMPSGDGERERAGACKFACATVKTLVEHSRREHGVDLRGRTDAGNVVISKIRAGAVAGTSEQISLVPLPLGPSPKRERKQNLADRTYSLPPGTVVTKAGKVSKLPKSKRPQQQSPPSPPPPEFNYSVVKVEPEVVEVD